MPTPFWMSICFAVMFGAVYAVFVFYTMINVGLGLVNVDKQFQT